MLPFACAVLLSAATQGASSAHAKAGYRRTCEGLAAHNQLRRGLTVEQCIAQLLTADGAQALPASRLVSVETANDLRVEVPDDWIIRSGGADYLVLSYVKRVPTGSASKESVFQTASRDAHGRLLAAVNIQFHFDQTVTQRDLEGMETSDLAALEQSARDAFASGGAGMTLLPDVRSRKERMQQWTALVTQGTIRMPNGTLFENRSIELLDGPGSMTVTATVAPMAPTNIKRACDALVDSILRRGPQHIRSATSKTRDAPGTAGTLEAGRTDESTALGKGETVGWLIGGLLIGGIIETAAMVGIGWVLRRRGWIAKNWTAALVAGIVVELIARVALDSGPGPWRPGVIGPGVLWVAIACGVLHHLTPVLPRPDIKPEGLGG